MVEALAAGVPVCCSNVSSLPEAGHGLAELFDPYDESSVAEAIDRSVQLGARGEWVARSERFQREVSLPSKRGFAAQIVGALDEVTSARLRG